MSHTSTLRELSASPDKPHPPFLWVTRTPHFYTTIAQCLPRPLMVIPTACEDGRAAAVISLYKRLFHFKALLWESIILLLPRPTCKAYPMAIHWYDHCAMYAPPHRPLLSMPYTIQYWRWQYRVKANAVSASPPG